MRIGMFETSEKLRRLGAEWALEQHDHERVVLDISTADLRTVDGIWVAELGEIDWTGENALFPLISIALDRGMPLIASGSGVQALIESKMLPGHLVHGTGGPRIMTVVADDVAWGSEAASGGVVSVSVEAESADWFVDEAQMGDHWRPAAHWSDGGIAAIATANGNLVGVLGEIDLSANADPSVDSGSCAPAHTWLANPTAMLAGVRLVDGSESA